MAEENKIIIKEPIVMNSKYVDKCASAFDKLDISMNTKTVNELSLVDMKGEDEESIWVAAEISTCEGIVNEWLKGELDLTGVTLVKNSLVDKLDNLARKSGEHMNEISLLSPPILPSDSLLSQPVSSTPAAKLTSDQPLNSTFNTENANSTFNREDSPPTVNGLNSTFSKDEEPNLNSTFANVGNAMFDQTGNRNINATFDLSKEKNNSSIDTCERIENKTIDMEAELKVVVSEASMSLDYFNDSSDSSKSFNPDPSSPASQPESQIQPRPESRLGGASIQHQLPRTILPPSSRLQVPHQLRYKAPTRSKTPPPTTVIPHRAPAPNGKIRSQLRPHMNVPRNVLRPPTEIHKAGLRLPGQVPGRTLRLPTFRQANVQKSSKSETSLSSRPPASVVESGLRKPSGIVRPSLLARPSGLARPTAGGAVQAGCRQGKT